MVNKRNLYFIISDSIEYFPNFEKYKDRLNISLCYLVYNIFISVYLMV